MSRVSRMIEIESITKDSKASKWCTVDTDNYFEYEDQTLRIADIVEQYKVTNKAVYKSLSWNDWTNDSVMDKILVVESIVGLKFYDQKLIEIPNTNIEVH